jgi:uncharacterized UPF0160 family protein
MSYSRWLNSVWYTFWMVQDKETENYDTAIFEICGVTGFTSKELRTNVQKCLNKVRKKVDATEEEILELKSYMNEFLEDVEKEYGKNNEKI